MLAEKFFLGLETVLSHLADAGGARYPDGGPKVLSSAQLVPVSVPGSLEPLQLAAVAPERRRSPSRQAPVLSPLLEKTLRELRELLIDPEN